MLAAQRRSRILAELSRDGTVRVTDLVELLGVSDMTVRRDLVALHRDGLLEKVHGGALAVAEPSSSEPGFAAKSVQRRREKEAIAAAAAELVHPGMAIAVSAGTTTHALTQHIARIPNLTVVTNSVWVADVLHRIGEPTTSVLLTGGLRTPSDALVGRSRCPRCAASTSTPSSWACTAWTSGPASAPPTCSSPRPTAP